MKGIWVGILSPYDESELLKAIQARSVSVTTSSNGQNMPNIPNYSSKDLDKLKVKEKVNILDLHERGFAGTRADAMVMPAIEMPYRALCLVKTPF